jgi:hypothetical protein
MIAPHAVIHSRLKTESLALTHFYIGNDVICHQLEPSSYVGLGIDADSVKQCVSTAVDTYVITGLRGPKVVRSRSCNNHVGRGDGAKSNARTNRGQAFGTD